MRICCIGDSNTYGFDPQSPMGGRYPYEVRWEGRLEAAGHSVANRGYNGLPVMRRSLHEMFARQLQREGPFDLVTVMLGTNDIILGSSAQETAADMAHLIERLKECAGGARLLLIAPPPLVPGYWVEGEDQILRSRELSIHFRVLAEKEGIYFADAGSWGIPLAYDGVHFTEEGHRIFAEKLIEKILRLVPCGCCAQDDNP